MESGEEINDCFEFYAKASNQDPEATLIFEELVGALSIAVSLSGGILDLDMVVIGGVWANFKEALIERLEDNFQTILERNGLKKPFSVISSTLGEDSDLLGAVGLVTNQWFTPSI